MLGMKKTKEGLRIDYTQGDSFKIGVKIHEGYEEISSLRLQILRAGGNKNPIITKSFYPDGEAFVVSLTPTDASVLAVGELYEYRLTLIKSSSVVTTISGPLNVKWGA